MISSEPKVIFRTNARNVEATIARTIDSVLAQTYPNWEFHMVDNASTDATAAIMEQYCQKDPRIKVFTNEANYVFKKGNKFYDYYKDYDLDNTYTCCIDADDEYTPDFLEKMLPFAIDNNLDIACCGYYFVHEITKKLLSIQKMDNVFILEGTDFGLKFPLYRYWMRIRWAKLFRLTVIDKVVFDDNFYMVHGGDTVEATECFRVAGRAGFCPEPYYVYYGHPDTVSYRWFAGREKAHRIIHDATINYLIHKAGHLTFENYDYMCVDFLGVLEALIQRILDAKIDITERITVLHDVFTSRYTRMLAAHYTADSDMALKSHILDMAGGWINKHEEELNKRNDLVLTAETITAIGQLTDNIVPPEWIVMRAVICEDARSVLEISGFGDSRCGEWVMNPLKPFPAPRVRISDRIDLAGTLAAAGTDTPYNSVISSDALSDIDNLGRYDIIIIFHLFENMALPDAKATLEKLLERAKKQVLVITPEYPYDLGSSDENKISDVRAYHPVAFLGMDFSYKLFRTEEGLMQVYSFFPKTNYELLPVDELPAGGISGSTSGAVPPETPNSSAANARPGKKLNIGYVLVHNKVTGAIKTIFSQIKTLSDRGHRITIYSRSDTGGDVIPDWSVLTNSYTQKIGQVPVPAGAPYLDYVKSDEDVIILSWMNQAMDFAGSPIPVALWEQGTPSFFGDYGRLEGSTSRNRQILHGAYRVPVRLLAVSETVRVVLKGMFNREALLFPNGIDTDFYHPCEEKNNDVPVVLLVGYPPADFKGFRLVFKVLETAHEVGLKFTAQIVSPLDFVLPQKPVFDHEIYIDPPQQQLAEFYRRADVFMTASLYESFSLPPLEAMASGTAVIAMDCGGINAYAEPGVNCLMCEQGDTFSMLYALEHLLQNPGVRAQLAAGGRETALHCSFPQIAPVWEECLYKIAGR